MKIDLVYAWVNGNDPEWQQKKTQYQTQSTSLNKDAVAKARFFDNEELRFSLRSVERYAPWINHIYIVTDNQTPQWLNVDHPKITIVDHKDIIPERFLPVFNSNVIEWHFPNIPNLSEHYLFSNDDMFFGRPCTPELFFDENGDPIEYVVRFREEIRLKPSFYQRSLINAADCFTCKTGMQPTFSYGHVMTAQRKSYVNDVKATFTDELEEVYSHRFRRDNDIPHYLVSLYDHALGRRSLVYPARTLKEKIFRNSRTVFLSPERTSIKLLKLKLLPARLICVNDGDGTTDSCRGKARRFYESFFPNKSEFEL